MKDATNMYFPLSYDRIWGISSSLLWTAGASVADGDAG